MDQEKNLSQVIRERIKKSGARFWAGDNISEFIKDSEKAQLINEVAEKFEVVLQSLIIDTENDPNSKGTAKRLAKMYVQETMAGRYDAPPDATAFPNDSESRYEGMLVEMLHDNSNQDVINEACDEEIFYVYMYVDPATKEVMYVGKGKDMRYLHHFKYALTHPVPKKGKIFLNTLRKRLRTGFPHPSICIPYAGLTEKDALDMERKIISQLGRKDLGTGLLLNQTEGGLGGAISPEINKKSHNTKKYKQKISKIVKAYWSDITDEDYKKRCDAVANSYDDSLRELKSTKLSNDWAINREKRIAAIVRTHKLRSEEEKKIISEKISTKLKTNSSFVTHNPKSIETITEYGTFPSKTEAFRFYKSYIDSNITRWKFDALLNKTGEK